VVCASRVTGANVGITWLYEGIVGRNWWTSDDTDLLAEQPTCTGEAVTESFQAAINIAGIGKALPNNLDTPLDCFNGFTSRSFLEALDQHLTDGYDTPGVLKEYTVVERPYMELRAHSADGVCAIAKTVGYLLGEGYSADDLREPGPELHKLFVGSMKTGIAFHGVSGWVNFTGNDKPESLAVKQVQGGDFVTVGLAFPNGSMRLDMNGGLVNESWKPAKEDAEADFPYLIFQVLTPLLCICCPALAGCIRSAN